MENKEVKLKSGDLVRLKSGGPVLTVQTVEAQIVTCKWFLQGELKDGKFNMQALELANN